MGDLAGFVDQRLLRGYNTFSRTEVEAVVGRSKGGLTARLTRLVERRKLATPRRGFYVILRPEDQALGAPEPAEWIDPLMRFLALDYRVSLLRAAAFHGSSHQAAMLFQVIVPRQLRPITVGRQRVEFVHQRAGAFDLVNGSPHLDTLKTRAGFARIAGVELTLLDCARYFHRAGGLNGLAQISKDLGGSASPRRLARLAPAYESTCARRLGYMLERFGHERGARALEPIAKEAKSFVPLDPSVSVASSALSLPSELCQRWKLTINEHVEVDT